MTYWNRKITSMENFKAFGIDYEYYLSLSDCPESLCLSERQMYVLRVQNSYTSWLTRWYNADDTNQLEVAFIAAEIEELLMGCGCGIPSPSFTDYINSQIYVEGASLVYGDTLSDWNTGGQTVVSIAPNLNYPTGVPADITKLMCLAWGLLLDVILEQAKVIKTATTAQQQNLTSQLSAVFAGAAAAGGIAALGTSAAAGIVAFFGGPFLILGLALASVGLGIASIIQGIPDATLVDAAAIENVLCILKANATGMTPTRAIFMGALTPNGFAAGSNEAKIATIVQPYLNDLNTYLQFIQQMSALYDVAPASALPACDTCTWTHTFDFTTSNGGFTAQLGTYSAGTGWISGLENPAVNSYRGVVLTRAFATAFVTGGTVSYAATYGTTALTGDYLGLLRIEGVDFVGTITPVRPPNPMAGTGAVTADDILIVLQCGISLAWNVDPGGTMTVSSATFTGTGVNPFL